MSDESLIKAEKDFTHTLDAQFPEIDQIVKTDAAQGLERLLLLEKQVRQASDLVSSKRVLTKIIHLFKQTHDWKLMNEQVQLLSKKHGQLKVAITHMIQEVIDILDSIPELDTKIETIENIRTVTEGKIFVEVERARVSRTLAHIKQEQGDVAEATKILCELQVETYGSMDHREKTEFILEQVELCLKIGDYTQALILSRKIMPRTLNKEDLQDLKLRYYELRIEISLEKNDYLDICQHYQAIYSLPCIANDEVKWKEALSNIVHYIILAPYDNLQSDLINKIALDPRLPKLTLHHELVKNFTAYELMRWPKVKEIYGSQLRASTVFDTSKPSGQQHWRDLRMRVIEHNIRVVCKYYTRIRISRLNTLLDLSEKETEDCISKLVTQGTIFAKINRPQRIVNFSKPKDSNEILNEWSNNISTLLGHVETIGHLITKEEMMNGIKSSS
ncbi:PCI-domain-containing protein [Nadsonia fulvescens var. elongata DSM 6958]|uniref:PCI-domain-containing protein n=1 Tax=Nadsonia fulvescens var. elongata DSM 6958 TaxID=857566 RepID=A0A1E3PQ42_9ASCO|nr:PCI-domain-containing protein [Nadsonia fulvescens var. elongata DSM 6958]